VKARKEKYSVEAGEKTCLTAADDVKRHSNSGWSAEDDKDLVHFPSLKTGFRDDEIAHAQYSDISFENGHGERDGEAPWDRFPGHPEITWVPKKTVQPARKNIVIDDCVC